MFHKVFELLVFKVKKSAKTDIFILQNIIHRDLCIFFLTGL